MNEQLKYDVIKRLVDHGCKNKDKASLKLGVTIRHINRMIAGYNKYGKEFFVHGNTGRTPSNKTPEKLKERVVNLYKTKETLIKANFQEFILENLPKEVFPQEMAD